MQGVHTQVVRSDEYNEDPSRGAPETPVLRLEGLQSHREEPHCDSYPPVKYHSLPPHPTSYEAMPPRTVEHPKTPI